MHDIVSNVSVDLALSLSLYIFCFLLSCCSCPTRLVLCRFCPALLFLLFDMNKGLNHNECYSKGTVVAHIQSILLRKLRLYTIKMYVYAAFLYIYIYTYTRTCNSVSIHAVVIVVSDLRSWPAHSALKRERVIANAALTLASGGKFKALLAWPTLSFFLGHCGWGTR